MRENGWSKSEFRAPQKHLRLDYHYCILCYAPLSRCKPSPNDKLFQHHIFTLDNISDHNSVNNVVWLCELHHKFYAHQGHWGFSLASRNPSMKFYYNDLYDSAKMLAVVMVAGRLWRLNPYNRIEPKFRPYPKCYKELIKIFRKKIAKATIY